MPARHAVLLTPSMSLRLVFPYFLFSKSFPCHRSEKSPVSLAIATLPKTVVSNPCVCVTSETPRGVVTLNIPALFNLSPFLSHSCALFCTTDVPQLFSNQPVTHSFPCDGGCTPLALLFFLRAPRRDGQESRPPTFFHSLLLTSLLHYFLLPLQSLRFHQGVA